MALPADDPPPGVPEWVVTYGDMMSLLLTFFIMLVSMSELKDQGKLRMMMDALQQRFGPTDGLAGAPGRSLQTNSALDQLSSNGSAADGGLKRSSRDAAGRAGASPSVRRIGHQTLPTLGGPIRFERFEASLTAEAQQDVVRLAAALSGQTNRVMVRGHATPEPPPADCKFNDAWDLSYARAAAVAESLVRAGLPRARLIVSAAGDTEPVRRGAEAAQVHNRRVDVFVIDAYTTPAAP